MYQSYISFRCVTLNMSKLRMTLAKGNKMI